MPRLPAIRRDAVACATIAVALAAAGGAGSWLYTTLTTTARQCQAGSGGSDWGLLVFVALVVLTPVGVGVYARIARAELPDVLAPAVFGTFLALVAVFLGATYALSAHNCLN